MLNTQVHEATKHIPYKLVFGQPPRFLLVPDATFKGKINEEELAKPSQEEENDSIAEEPEDHDRVHRETSEEETRQQSIKKNELHWTMLFF